MYHGDCFDLWGTGTERRGRVEREGGGWGERVCRDGERGGRMGEREWVGWEGEWVGWQREGGGWEMEGVGWGE